MLLTFSSLPKCSADLCAQLYSGFACHLPQLCISESGRGPGTELARHGDTATDVFIGAIHALLGMRTLGSVPWHNRRTSARCVVMRAMPSGNWDVCALLFHMLSWPSDPVLRAG